MQKAHKNILTIFWCSVHTITATLFKLDNGGGTWFGIFGDQRVTAAHTVN